MAINSMEPITTTGRLRDLLARAVERAEQGRLSAADGRNIVGLANQITTSMAVEIKHQNMQSALGMEVTVFGNVNIGENKQ